MPATLESTFSFSVEIDGVKHSMTVRKNLPLIGLSYNSGTIEIAPNSTKTVFDMSDASFSDQLTPASGPTRGFAFLVLWNVGSEDEPDRLIVELTTDAGGQVGSESYTFDLPSGSFFVLFSNGSYADYSAGFAGGTLDSIERVRIRNLSASTVAKMKVFAAK